MKTVQKQFNFATQRWDNATKKMFVDDFREKFANPEYSDVRRYALDNGIPESTFYAWLNPERKKKWQKRAAAKQRRKKFTELRKLAIAPEKKNREKPAPAAKVSESESLRAMLKEKIFELEMMKINCTCGARKK